MPSDALFYLVVGLPVLTSFVTLVANLWLLAGVRQDIREMRMIVLDHVHSRLLEGDDEDEDQNAK